MDGGDGQIWFQFACWGSKVIGVESTTIDPIAIGDMSFDAGAMIFPNNADASEALTYSSAELTDLKVFSVTQEGAASLVAAATAVAVSLALF